MKVDSKRIPVLLRNKLNEINADFLSKSPAYTVVKVPTRQAIGSYTIRFRVQTESPFRKRRLNGYAKTLQNLTDFHEEYVLIHSIVCENSLVLFFSDEAITKIIGYIDNVK